MSLRTQYEHLVEQLPGYEPRPQQWEMVSQLAQGLTQRQHVVIEAGTGSGKSFGYLIPALMSDVRPIVISTGTIALQEQLIEKDIPFLAEAADLEQLKVKLVKGRRNYLCIHKLVEFEKTLGPTSSERLYVNLLKSELDQGWDGDKANLDFEMPSDLWEEVQSDSEDCLGKRCQFYAENPYRLAREDIDEADILVVNHALYLQDVISGQALLPPHEVVIFDEAHQLRSIAMKAFTARIGKFATQKLIRKIDRRVQAIPAEYQRVIIEVEAQILQWLFRQEKSVFRLYADPDFERLIQLQVQVLTELRSWLASVNIKQLALNLPSYESDVMHVQREKLLNQLEGLAGRWELFLSFTDPDRVNWAEVNSERLYFEIKSTPLNTEDFLAQKLWSEKIGMFTSATLGVNQSLQAFRTALGLPSESQKMSLDRILPSPFNYAEQCQLYLPSGLPEPNDPLFLAASIDQIIQILQHSQGRAFVLFTSYQAMRQACLAVVPQVAFPCKMQGDLPKNRLIDWFKTTPNSVLFATATFWEGIDIPGESLSCVIMDRIPFTMPDEPVHQAYIERLKRHGKDWFNGYVLPEATIRLKQGFGRLIRRQDDRGIVAILDPRLQSKGYGKTILRSLPKTQIVQTLPVHHF